MSIADVVQQIDLSAEKVDEIRTLLTDIADLIDGASETLGAALVGTSDAECIQLVAHFTSTQEAVTTLGELVQTLANTVGNYRASTVGHGPRRNPGSPLNPEKPAASTNTASGEVAASGEVPRSGKADKYERSSVARIQELLPPEVVPNTGTKTHGMWFDNRSDQPAQSVVSGRDSDADAVDDFFISTGLHPRRKIARSGDVEQKVAFRMRTTGITHATVIINNIPCEGPFSCDTLVPVILPAGYTLTVHGPNGFTKTFKGGNPPPW